MKLKKEKMFTKFREVHIDKAYVFSEGGGALADLGTVNSTDKNLTSKTANSSPGQVRTGPVLKSVTFRLTSSEPVLISP